MPSGRMRLHSLALAQGGKKALKQVNGVLWKPRTGAFGKSVRRKFLKSSVFRGQEALCPEVSLPKWRAHIGHRQKKRGGKSWECRVIRFTTGRAKKEGKMNYFTGICAVKSLARRVTTTETQSATHAFSGSRKQRHDFLDQKPGVLRNGGKWHVLGLPTIIIIKKF